METKKKLEKEIESLEKKLYNDKVKVGKNKKSLSLRRLYKVQIKRTEEGEKPSKYFSDLEPQKCINKQIS